MLFFSTISIVTKLFLFCTSADNIHSTAICSNNAVNNSTTISRESNSGQESAPSPIIYSSEYAPLSGLNSDNNQQALLYEIFKQQSATHAVMNGDVLTMNGGVQYQPAHETIEMPSLIEQTQNYHKEPSYFHRSPVHEQNYEEENIENNGEPLAAKMLFDAESDYYKPAKSSSRYSFVFSNYLSHDPRSKKCSSSRSSSHSLNMNDIETAFSDAEQKASWYVDTIEGDGINTKRRTPFIPNGAIDSKMFEFASEAITKRKCYSKTDVVTLLPNVNMKYAKRMAACRSKGHCEEHSKYRRSDGSCNNLHSPEWASSFSCHRRLLPPDYADGVGSPRISYDGSPLPNARDLSTLLLPDLSVQDHRMTSMSMAFGQFAIHDITRTLPFAGDIKCCDESIPLSKRHPECFPIFIKRSDDPLMHMYNQTCLNFVRTTVCNRCGLGPREQQNQATATFDLSHMYGNRLNDTNKVREHKAGRLRSSVTATVMRDELLPKSEVPGCNVRPEPPRFKCFDSPDGIRASQHPALQALHVAFHRRHNMHAASLSNVNPHWNDEKLFQEARRLCIAEMTSIVFGEYLPTIFGRKLLKHFRLGLAPQGKFTKYDERLNPSTIQEFITAAGRFGHSNINEQFRVLTKPSSKQSSFSYLIGDNFFETTIVSLGHSSGILKGLAMDSTESSDPYFVDEIRNRLYHLRTERFGRDLPANNIQRGRDHAIAGYVHYLNFCFGFKVKSWEDLITFIPKKQVQKIRAFYPNWRDIDLFVGGISERLIGGAAFGPTFACIIGIQFYNIKYGDRYYFEHDHQSGSFSLAQLDNIRATTTLASLLCKTHPEIEKITGNVFIQPDKEHNRVRSCYDFADIDYSLWTDKGASHMEAEYSTHQTKPIILKHYSPKPVTRYEVKYMYDTPYTSIPKRRKKISKEDVSKNYVYYHNLSPSAKSSNGL